MVYYEREPMPELPKYDQILFEEECAFGIKEKLDMMQFIIKDCIAFERTEPKRIATIQNNLQGKESYYMHNAVLMLLDSRGLLDKYYDDESAYKEIENGWEVVLSAPLANTRYKEQFRFVSKDGLELGNSSTQLFMLFYQLKFNY